MASFADISAKSILDLPKPSVRQIGGTALAKRGRRAPTIYIGRAQYLIQSEPTLDRSPNLSAGRWLFVDHPDGQPIAACDYRCRHARGASTDDKKVYALNGTNSLVPAERVTTIPSSTICRQVWSDGTPFTVARQSKHTPIMQ
jgi:hypothetical protein